MQEENEINVKLLKIRAEINKIWIYHSLLSTKKTREYTYNKNYKKLSQKLTKITLFTTKNVVYCTKLTTIIETVNGTKETLTRKNQDIPNKQWRLLAN
jgi:hypothetical protein